MDVLFLSLLLAGLAIGVIEVAVNLEADRIEYATGIHLDEQSPCFLVSDFFTTAIIGASASQFGISVLSHLSGLGMGIFLISFWCFYRYEQAPARPSDATAPPLFVRPTRAIMVLVFLTLWLCLQKVRPLTGLLFSCGICLTVCPLPLAWHWL